MNLMEHHGEISLEDVTAHAQTHVGMTVTAAQNNNVMHGCLMATVTEQAKNALLLQIDKFTFNQVKDGAASFKVIIMGNSN